LQRAAQLSLPEKLVAFVKLQSATLFLRLGSPKEAMRELHVAQEIAPDEPDVHFMLGKAYMMSEGNNKAAALKCFTIALSLSPATEAIKGALTSLDGAE
jgi:anaphase-promoting complex subunit 3